MKTFKFIMFLFFRYYSTGTTKNFAYIKTLGAVVFLIYLHLFLILIVSGLVNRVININIGDSRLLNTVKLQSSQHQLLR